MLSKPEQAIQIVGDTVAVFIFLVFFGNLGYGLAALLLA